MAWHACMLLLLLLLLLLSSHAPPCMQGRQGRGVL
jgi:hypothetical protein